jgi:hypothetical protein
MATRKIIGWSLSNGISGDFLGSFENGCQNRNIEKV